MLFGLAVAAVPLILHLLNRRRRRRVAFSDLRFLDEVQARRSRSFALRRSLLLLLRILILLLIALALARPRLAGLASGVEGGANVLLVLDASAGLQATDGTGRRFDHLRDRAASLAAGLPGGSAVQVIAAGPTARPVFAGWTEPGPAVARALASLEPTDGRCDLAVALEEAARWADSAGRRPAVVLFLTDGQAPGADPALDRAAATLADAGVDGLMVATVGEPYENGGVLAVETPLRALTVGESLEIAADVRLGRPEQPFWLTLDDRRVAETVVQGRPGELRRILFAVTAPEPGVHAGVVGTDHDRLHVDDRRPFTLTVRDRIEILLAHGADRAEAVGRGGRRYWAEALDDGGADPLFHVHAVPSASLEDGDLETADVVLLIDPDPLGRRVLEALTAAVRGGTGLLLQTGDPARIAYLDATLLPALGLQSGIEPRRFSAAGAQGIRLLRPDHPLFAGWPGDALATLGQSRWLACLAPADTTLTTLVALADDTPLIQSGRLGSGRLLRLNAGLSPDVTDLALNPMFPPLARRLVTDLVRDASGDGLEVGEAPRLVLSAATRLSGLGVEPRAEFLPVPEAGIEAVDRPAVRIDWEGREPRLGVAGLDRQGFYRFTAGTDTLGLLAVAVPAMESEPLDGNPDALIGRLAAAGLIRSRSLPTADADAFGAALRGRELAPWLLGLAILLLLIETLLSRGNAAPGPLRRGT